MKYIRLREGYEDDIEYDMLVVFDKDYEAAKIDKVMEGSRTRNKSIRIEEWLNSNGLKVKDTIMLEEIDVYSVD